MIDNWRFGRHTYFNTVAAVAATLLMMSEGVAVANTSLKTCPDVEVRSIKASCVQSQDMGGPVRPAPANPEPKIMVTPTGTFDPFPNVTVIMTGPTLGEMDSHEITTALSCTASGLVLTAIITRSADYNEQEYVDDYNRHAILRPPFFWHPCIELDLAVHQPPPDVSVEAKWIMSLNNGTIVDHARTYMFPEHAYPVIVNTTIRADNVGKR